MRIIPGRTNVKIELFKGISLVDFLIGLAFAGLMLLVSASTIPGKWIYVLVILFLAIALLTKIGDEPNYRFFLSIFRHMVYRKKYTKGGKGKGAVDTIMPFTGIADDFILYGGSYYGAVLEVPPVEFRFFSETRRTISIDDCLGAVLRNLPDNYSANIVKLERRVPYDAYIQNEQSKLDELRRVYENGLMTEDEFRVRCEIIFDRMNELEQMNTEERIVAPYYYIALFDSDKSRLRLQINNALNLLQRGEMPARRLGNRDLALFLKYSNTLDFDEAELDSVEPSEYAHWAMPDSVKIRSNTAVVDQIVTYTMAVSNYPLRVGDAWMAGVMSVPGTKVVVKCRPMDRTKTIRSINRSIAELRAKYAASGVDSTRMELSNHIESLGELLALLQSDNEAILQTDIYITAYDLALTVREGKSDIANTSALPNIGSMRTTLRRIYREAELRLTSLQFNQTEGFIGSQISGYDPFADLHGRGIPAGTVAGMYPWIYAHVDDQNGIKLGSEGGVPVFLDMFRRDYERVNSNVVIVGKSGSGKSYAAKSILSNLAADDSKIFILDPENEYTELAENLHGKFINVGNAQQGRLNPFHIITALDDDTEGAGSGSFASHMQFLEEFYRQILPDCDKDALEYLNSLTSRIYADHGITEETDLSRLRPEDYPVFDDLYDAILAEFQRNENEYIHAMLRTLMNYVSKFATGGRNANIWNGPSTVTTEENFTVFNFQSLLANGNSTVANAQMLLVLKYIDNEIMKNRDYNTKYRLNRKVVVVIDEAHVFIDEKYPVALDFMYQLAKRIRKYNGMQVVITQNIKDFVGTEEISRKSSAIINACQYSFIFPMAPYDLADLCRLYEKAGGINESEQEKIVTAPRGNAFVILGPSSRSSFQIEVPENVVRIFSERNAESNYFGGEEGAQTWDDFLGTSRDVHDSAISAHEIERVEEETKKRSTVLLTEISEEEYEQERSVEAETLLSTAEPEKTTGSTLFQEFNFTEDISEPIEAPERAVYNSVPAAAPISTAAAAPAAPVAPVVITQSSAEKEQMAKMLEEMRKMMELMGKFSYESILTELMSRMQSGSASGQQSAPSSASQETRESTAEEDVFAAFTEEPAAQEPAETSPDLGDFEDFGFDLLSQLLAAEQEEPNGETVLESMERTGETVRTITLEDLIKLNKQQKH